MERREFIKLLGITGASLILPGCHKNKTELYKKQLQNYQIVTSSLSEEASVMVIRFDVGHYHKFGVVKRLFTENGFYEETIYEPDNENLELSFYNEYKITLKEGFLTVIEQNLGDKKIYTSEEINNLLITYEKSKQKTLIKPL